MSKSESSFPPPLHSPNTRSSGVQDERDEKMVAANALPSPRFIFSSQFIPTRKFLYRLGFCRRGTSIAESILDK
jgi:hypothetical protein